MNTIWWYWLEIVVGVIALLNVLTFVDGINGWIDILRILFVFTGAICFIGGITRLIAHIKER